jgi:RNA polymerase sigma factor for flagellar operon FliA
MDEPAKHALVAEHLPLVRMIASRLYRLRWNAAVDFDDYCQMGALGLVEAAQRFDPSHGVQFGSFASWRISGAILNGLTRSTEQLQQAAERRRRVKSRVDELAGPEDGAAPDDGSVEAALARISRLAVGLAVGFMLEDTGMYQGDEASHRLDGYASIALRQWRGRLRAAVLSLPPQERDVLERHYFHQHPFHEIAEALGLTRGRISQIHTAALERLREVLAQDNAGFEA